MVDEMAPLRTTGFGDPGWEHGSAQDDRKKKVKCNYCGKVVSGGIYRLKQHLARVSGEVTYCDKAPEEVYLKMKENLGGYRSSKKPRRSEHNQEHAYDFHSSNNDDGKDESSVGYRSKGKHLMGDESFVINLAPLRSLGYVDPGWEHGVAQDERKKKVKCNYCDKVVSGGINRFKQHLARIPGEVAPCKNAPDEVYLRIKENMKWHRTGRRNRRPDAKEISAFYMPSDNEEDEEEDVVRQMGKGKLLMSGKRLGRNLKSGSEPLLKHSRLDSVFVKTPSHAVSSPRQLGAKTFSNKKARKEVISAICEFFYYAGIPSDAANSPYFHRMLELVGQYGPDLAGPSTGPISGRCLQDEIATVRNHLLDHKASWAITGCSVMADSWKNMQGRTLINFLVSCPRGVYFHSSVDATDLVEDATNLFKLLDKVVEEMGEENVVQVITENTPSYKAAGKILEEKRRNLFWTPCASHCIDQLLGDFMKIKWVVDCMEKGQMITRFIYNRIWLLHLMKTEFTDGQELLRPGLTRYSTSFMTLQNLLDHRISLKRMFQSNKWHSSQFSKSDEGKEAERIILNATFWKKMQYIKRSVDPIVQLIQKVNINNKGLRLPFIYNDMYRAKLAIRTINGDDTRKYGSFWSVIDNNWNSLFHHPLYVAAYFLNPSFRYRADYLAHPEVMRGLNECIARLEQDSGRRISASMQISDFVSAKADFGTDLAISTRTELDPAAWWQQHGINCLELQRIAIRILSQTCSSYGCEHNWSKYDQVHIQKRNRIARKRLNDIIYVHYNLRLREGELRKRGNEPITLDNVLLDSLLDDWIVEAERESSQEDEQVPYNEMEHSDTYENDGIEYEDGNLVTKKSSSIETTTSAHVEPLEVIPANSSAASDEDDDDDDNHDDDDANLDFFDDDEASD